MLADLFADLFLDLAGELLWGIVWRGVVPLPLAQLRKCGKVTEEWANFFVKQQTDFIWVITGTPTLTLPPPTVLQEL